MSENYCVIMAGGVGSRFWPASTAENPKQFLDILGTGRTLLQQTFDRFKSIIKEENVLILTNERYKELVQHQLPSISQEQIICEPARRNTAPCILYAAIKIWKINPDASFIVAPADHLITNIDEFNNAICLGLEVCKKDPNKSITLGIKPWHASTGFGYIKRGALSQEGVFYVEQFTEKPILSVAKEMLKSGDYYWNSGLFIWNAKRLLDLFKELQPEMYELFNKDLYAFNSPLEKETLKVLYPKCEDISVDYAILEQDQNVFVIPGDFGWSDLGSWSSLKDHVAVDEQDNTIIGSQQKLLQDSSNNIIVLPKEKKALIAGLSNYIVVDTHDSILICPIEHEQDIKSYLSRLNEQ